MLHESANCLLIEYQSTILSHFLKPRRLSCTSSRLGGIRMCTGSVCFHLIKQRRESLIVLYYVLLCTKPALISKCRINKALNERFNFVWMEPSSNFAEPGKCTNCNNFDFVMPKRSRSLPADKTKDKSSKSANGGVQLPKQKKARIEGSTEPPAQPGVDLAVFLEENGQLADGG